MTDIYTVLLKGAQTAFDIGAHHGNFTRHLLASGVERVVAVEPQPAAFAELGKIEDERVTLLNYAISDRVGKSKMWICSQASTLSTMNPDWKNGRFNRYAWESSPIGVETLTLDELISITFLPDYIKVDAEGYDHVVLASLSVAVRAVSFEFEIGFMPLAILAGEHLDSIGEYEFSWTRGDYYVPGSPFTILQDVISEIKTSGSQWGMIHARSIDRV